MIMVLHPFDEWLGWVNLACLLWFLACWLGYAKFAKKRAGETDCLASTLHKLRLAWMRELLYRDQRVSDTSIIANLERNVAFMASTSIFVLAGLVTALAGSEEAFDVFSRLSFIRVNSINELQFKLLVLISIFIYAFFTFTWSLRQFGFCSIIFGASPTLERDNNGGLDTQEYAKHAGKVLDQASHSYNYGLRSYYYAISVLAWFIHPLLFIVAVALVVRVLYQREFKSSTLTALLQVQKDWHKSS